MTRDIFNPAPTPQPEPAPTRDTVSYPGSPTQPTQPATPPSTTLPGGSYLSDLFGIGSATSVPQDMETGYDFMPERYSVELDTAGNVLGYIVKWRLIWNGALGGQEKTYGDLATSYDRMAYSDGMDYRYDRHGFLALKTTVATSPDPTGTLTGLHWRNIFDTLILGIGGGANVSLLKETSATDPTITTITYTPGAVISCLGDAIFGSISTARRLIIGRTASAPQIISDATGTVDATMHTDLAYLWGVQQTILTGLPVLYYAANHVKSHQASSTVTAAPTAVGTNVLPAGGFSLGLCSRGGGPLRWYLFIPLTNTTTGALAFGAEKTGKIISLNQKGEDLQEMTSADFLGLGPIIACGIWEDGIWATDGKRVVYNRDHEKVELGYSRDREADSDRETSVRGCYVKGALLVIEENSIAAANATAATYTRRTYVSYDRRTNAFQNIGTRQTVGTSTGVQTVLAAGNMPVSDATGFLHCYTSGNTSWHRKFEPPYSINPFNYYRQTTGADTDTGQVWDTSGSSRTTKWTLPRPLQGWPSVISQITPLGNVDAGGAATSYTSKWGGVQGTFRNGFADAEPQQRAPFPDNRNYFYVLQGEHAITQGSSTYKTPNICPEMIEGYTFIGVPPRPPSFVNDQSLGLVNPLIGR